MGKTTLRIDEVEEKISQAGRKYWRINTSEGWCSSFDKTLAEALAKAIGSDVSVEIREKDNFKNITRIYVGDVVPVVKPGNVVAKTVKRVDVEANKQAGVATRYAVDLCIAKVIKLEDVADWAKIILGLMRELTE